MTLSCQEKTPDPFVSCGDIVNGMRVLVLVLIVAAVAFSCFG